VVAIAAVVGGRGGDRPAAASPPRVSCRRKPRPSRTRRRSPPRVHPGLEDRRPPTRPPATTDRPALAQGRADRGTARTMHLRKLDRHGAERCPGLRGRANAGSRLRLRLRNATVGQTRGRRRPPCHGTWSYHSKADRLPEAELQTCGTSPWASRRPWRLNLTKTTHLAGDQGRPAGRRRERRQAANDIHVVQGDAGPDPHRQPAGEGRRRRARETPGLLPVEIQNAAGKPGRETARRLVIAPNNIANPHHHESTPRPEAAGRAPPSTMHPKSSMVAITALPGKILFHRQQRPASNNYGADR